MFLLNSSSLEKSKNSLYCCHPKLQHRRKGEDIQQQCNKECYMFTDVTILPPKQNIRNNCDSYLSGTAVHSVAETCKKRSLCKHVMLTWVNLTLTYGTIETISTFSEYRKYLCYIITQLDSLLTRTLSHKRKMV